jgi:hypothetical protein
LYTGKCIFFRSACWRLLFFAQPKKSNQKKGCPDDLALRAALNENLFLTGTRLHNIPVVEPLICASCADGLKTAFHFGKS